MDEEIDESMFIDLINTNVILFKKIFENDLIISEWTEFTNSIDEIYEKTKNHNKGNLVIIYHNYLM